MYIRIIFLLVGFVCFSQSGNYYARDFYENGTLKAKGWQEQNVKTAYWYFYYPDGTVQAKGSFEEGYKNGYWFYYDQQGQLVKEGHFEKDKETSWWVFYKNKIMQKVQYNQGNKEGYALLYKNGTLFKAERYKNNNLTGAWTSLSGFKKDNPNARF